MASVLIAGCGYVGEALAALLVADGHQVFCARRGARAAPPGATALVVDLAAGPLDAVPRGLDLAVFAAAPGGRTPENYENVYVRALSRVLALGPGRLVLASSTSVYAQDDGSWVDEGSPAAPAHFTGAAVVRGEKLLRPGDAAVRLGGIYGPGRESFLAAVRAGTFAVAARSAYTNRIHRDDAAGVLRHVAALRAPLPVYNAVDCAPAPRAEVAQWIARRLGVVLPRAETPEALAKRVRNDRLLASGYRFLFPTYREGYEALIGAK